MRLQNLVQIRQNFPDRGLPDVAGAVRAEMETAGWALAVKPGSRIAVGVGSRGITNIDIIARSVVGFWKSRDVKPYQMDALDKLSKLLGYHKEQNLFADATVHLHFDSEDENA